jgi:RNA methyltransferase, TrmH family
VPDTSPNALGAKDPRVVRAARLLRSREAREADGLLAVDGRELLDEALAAGLEPVEVLTGFDRSAGRMLAVAGQAPELVAVLPLPAPAPLAPLPPRALVLAGVADAGNVGSIVRTAVAFGVPRVVHTPPADPCSRRALRASLGAALRPGLLAAAADLAEVAAVPDRPPLAAAVARGGLAPHELPAGAVVVLGAERDGLAAADVARCELAVTIPAHGFESLNVAAAAAILVAALA